MANEIVSTIILDLDQYKRDLKDARDMGEKAGRESGQSLGDGIENGLTKSIGGLKAALASAAAAVGAAFTLKEAIHAAAEQEQAIQRLNSALMVSGKFSQEASDHAIELSESLAKVTTTADEVILKGEATLATLGKLSGEGLDRATKASLDLAAALNIDVDTAFNLVSKAATGHAAALSRYGIQVKSTGDDAADFERVLATVEKRFHGLAEAQTGTFSGAMAQTKNAFGEILESLGNLVIKSPTVISLLHALRDAFLDAASAVEQLFEGRDVIQEIGLAAIQTGFLVNQYVVLPLELAFNTLKTGALALATIFQTLRASITGTGEDIALSLGEQTQQAAQNIFDFDATLASENFLNKAKTFFETVKPPVAAEAATMKETVQNSFNGLDFTQVISSFKAAAVKIDTIASDLGKQLNAVLVTGVGNAFAAMGAALAKGEDAFAAFGKVILGVLGDLAIKFGTAYIALGIGQLFLGNIPGGLGLIGVGGALSALGGLLKAVAGAGGGGAAAPAATGGGGGVAAGAAAPATDVGQRAQEPDQRGKIGSQVTVNIQGNVLDRRETGLAIADVLNESFGSSGLTVATAET